MAVTGLVGMLPRRARYVIKTCMNVVMIVVLLCYIPGFITLMGRVTLSGLLRLPLKYVYSILPISFGLMSFHVLNNIVNDTCEEMAARGKKEGAAVRPPAVLYRRGEPFDAGAF